MKEAGLTSEQQEKVMNAIAFQKENMVKNNYYVLYLNFPSKRSVTKLDTAFKTDKNVSEFINGLVNFGEAIELLTEFKLFKNESYQFNSKTLKTIKSVQTLINSGNFDIVERDIKNSYINKTAWAIFTGEGEHSGFKAKNGELGEISTARLFDSDKGCEKTAKAMGLRDYEVVEVEVTLKKRTDIKTYSASKLDAAFSILEKERLEQFFAEMDHEKIEEKLQEVKAKKVNKL